MVLILLTPALSRKKHVTIVALQDRPVEFLEPFQSSHSFEAVEPCELHCYLTLTEIPLLLCDVPTLDFCLGEQWKQRERSGSLEVSYLRLIDFCITHL